MHLIDVEKWFHGTTNRDLRLSNLRQPLPDITRHKFCVASVETGTWCVFERAGQILGIAHTMTVAYYICTNMILNQVPGCTISTQAESTEVLIIAY